MTIYDALDNLNEVNETAYRTVIKAISNKASLRQQFEVGIRRESAYNALVSIFDIDTMLTPMCLQDLEERLS